MEYLAQNQISKPYDMVSERENRCFSYNFSALRFVASSSILKAVVRQDNIFFALALPRLTVLKSLA